MTFISFFCLIIVARTSSTMLNKSSKSGHPCLVPDLRGKAFCVLPLSKKVNPAVGLLKSRLIHRLLYMLNTEMILLIHAKLVNILYGNKILCLGLYFLRVKMNYICTRQNLLALQLKNQCYHCLQINLYFYKVVKRP